MIYQILSSSLYAFNHCFYLEKVTYKVMAAANWAFNHLREAYEKSAINNLLGAGRACIISFFYQKLFRVSPEKAEAIRYLKNAGIHTDENHALVCNNFNPEGLALGLVTLKNSDILSHQNRQAVSGHKASWLLAHSLEYLKKSDIEPDVFLHYLGMQSNPYLLARIIKLLDEQKMLDILKIQKVSLCDDLKFVENEIKRLVNLNLLNEESLDNLIRKDS